MSTFSLHGTDKGRIVQMNTPRTAVAVFAAYRVRGTTDSSPRIPILLTYEQFTAFIIDRIQGADRQEIGHTQEPDTGHADSDSVSQASPMSTSHSHLRQRYSFRQSPPPEQPRKGTVVSSATTMILGDLLAVSILVFGIYYPRHHRSDLVVAFLGVNVGVLAVSEVLGSSTVGAGLGLGLFGVLSIIRLRSSEISQREVAYYFAALALGLISGMSPEVTTLNISLMAVLLAVLAVADSRLLSSGVRTMEIRLDVAVGDPEQLPHEINARTGAEVVSATVQQIDFVNDTTLVTATVRTNSRNRLFPSHSALVAPASEMITGTTTVPSTVPSTVRSAQR